MPFQFSAAGRSCSLALTGAYVLAGELATRGDHQSAFAAYETLLRPYVAKAQKLPPGAPAIANPMSEVGVRLLRGFLRVAASKPVNSINQGGWRLA